MKLDQKTQTSKLKVDLPGNDNETTEKVKEKKGKKSRKKTKRKSKKDKRKPERKNALQQQKEK